jgi:hypothetical protein
MLEKTTRLVSENLARAVNRRSFLKRAGEVTFASVAAIAAGHTATGLALAGVRRQPMDRDVTPSTPPQCAPPGPYCNLNGVNEPNGCRGGACYQHMVGGQVYQCRVYYQWYQAGCWTTPVSGGYWVCCDCECGTPRVASCGCAQFSTAPVPRPDSPAGGGAAV